MPQIPITKYYAEATGKWCEKVENRSLLLDKFAFPKMWGEDAKEDRAFEWSLMRIASNGTELLRQKAESLGNPGRNVQVSKAETMKIAGSVCHCLAKTTVGSSLEKLRVTHTRRFLELLHADHDDARLRVVYAKLEGRLAINLAEGLIQNAGISLDRIFGLPLIPGSAVKGVTRAAAQAELQSNPDLRETFVRVFGTEECKGAVNFIQAMPINDAKIVVDITNVHYPNYYEGKEREAKTETPRPNYFPAVEIGTEFAFPILLNGMRDDPALLAAAEAWLKTALTENGVGAKTGAGYGWFSDVTAQYNAKQMEELETKRTEEEKAKEVASAEPDETFVHQFTTMKENKFLEKLSKFAAEEKYWFDREPFTNIAYQRSLLEAAIQRNPPGKNAQKAKEFLARKFKVELP